MSEVCNLLSALACGKAIMGVLVRIDTIAAVVS